MYRIYILNDVIVIVSNLVGKPHAHTGNYHHAELLIL